MPAFRYKHGDRPLEGYTIQRGVGRGGFGEVYYAISDSGREVALKVISGYEQIELRGVSQCMNLKSPHLVSVFDVRHNDEGTPFVIMEYVAGPSLRQLLDESPSGLGQQKAAFFLREIAKGLTYLHDCGIVHRDLKPGNIFYENGYVKIGDYGLSKAITASQHSGQTITVGTVHYMAPEIGLGKYDRGIDIYAMGAVLFELLTGQVPHIGSSPTEILMKHMTAEVDTSGIAEPFATVIKRAMLKDPAQRYQSIQEMVEAVFGAEHVQQSVSCFSPESLSMVAQRVARRAAVGAGSATPPPIPNRSAQATMADPDCGTFRNLGQRIGNRFAALVSESPRRADDDAPTGDPRLDMMSAAQRWTLAGVMLVAMSVATGIFADMPRGMDDGVGGFVAFLAIAGTSGGLILARRKLLPQYSGESVVIQRLAMGGLAVLGLMFASPGFFASGDDDLAWSVFAIAVPLFAMDWVQLMAPNREERVAFMHPFLAALFGFIVGLFFDSVSGLVMGVLAGTSLLVQILSPWDSFAAAGDRANDDWWKTDEAGAPPRRAPAQPPQVPMPAAPQVDQTPAAAPRILPQRVDRIPAAMRFWWIALFTVLIPSGVLLLVYPNVDRLGREETALSIAFGVGLLVLGLMSVGQSFRKRFLGWWSYLVRPLALWGCIQTILIAAIMLGHIDPRGEDALVGTFFIVFPAVLFIVLLFMRMTREGPMATDQLAAEDAAQQPAAGPERLRRPRATWQWGHALLALIGWLLLMGGLAAGYSVAVDLPGFAQEIYRVRGHEFDGHFPASLMRLLSGIGSALLILLAAAALMASRRWAGGRHVGRCAIALGLLISTIFFIGSCLPPQWQIQFLRGEPDLGLTLEHHITAANPKPAVLAGIATVLALTLLIWPNNPRLVEREEAA